MNDAWMTTTDSIEAITIIEKCRSEAAALCTCDPQPERVLSILDHQKGCQYRNLRTSSIDSPQGQATERAKNAALIRVVGCHCSRPGGARIFGGGILPGPHESWCPIALAARIEAGE